MSDKTEKNWAYYIYEKYPEGFAKGLLHGIGSYGTIWQFHHSFTFRPRYHSSGVRGDWELVGKDLRTALRKLAQADEH